MVFFVFFFFFPRRQEWARGKLLREAADRFADEVNMVNDKYQRITAALSRLYRHEEEHKQWTRIVECHDTPALTDRRAINTYITSWLDESST